MITVILNAYKRTDYLKEQIEAVRNQSIPPEDIWIWYNKPEDREQIELDAPGCKIVQSNHNFKFHGRFALGLLARTSHVAFFDDGIIWDAVAYHFIERYARCLGVGEFSYLIPFGRRNSTMIPDVLFQPLI